MSYHVLANASARDFEITCSLERGYEGEYRHAFADVTRLHHAWQDDTGTIQGVVIAPTTISWGALNVASDTPGPTIVAGESESGFSMRGFINPLYDLALPDYEARTRVISLATYLADRLGQVRIYVRFMREVFILEREA